MQNKSEEMTIKKSKSSNMKIIIGVGLIVLIFIAWFSWMSFITDKSNWMEKNVKASMKIALQKVEQDAPRMKFTNNEGYYVTDVNGYKNRDIIKKEAYEVVLESLNQNSGLPLNKVTQFNVGTYGMKEIVATARVRFNLLLGITKTIYVRQQIPLVHFQNPTGSQKTYYYTGD